MKNWKQLARLSCYEKKQKVGNTKFDSWGDWVCFIFQCPKESGSLEQKIKQAKAFKRLHQIQRKPVPQIKLFRDALKDCSMKYQNLDDFQVNYGIGELQHYQRLVKDGNRTIAIMYDNMHYYFIAYDTS